MKLNYEQGEQTAEEDGYFLLVWPGTMRAMMRDLGADPGKAERGRQEAGGRVAWSKYGWEPEKGTARLCVGAAGIPDSVNTPAQQEVVGAELGLDRNMFFLSSEINPGDSRTCPRAVCCMNNGFWNTEKKLK